LIPFTVTIPPAERDKGLLEKLEPEWPGILNWALEGCLEWQKIGLVPPAAVVGASEAYFSEEDLISTWIAECCAVDKIYSQSSGELYRSWAKWAEDAGERSGTNKAFSKTLQEKGFVLKHERDGNTFYGIALKPPEMSDAEASGRWWKD
jgi:putative DNA primase/helicase